MQVIANKLLLALILSLTDGAIVKCSLCFALSVTKVTASQNCLNTLQLDKSQVKEVPMRIGIFTDAYVPQIGGVSTASQLIKRQLNKRGHEAYVITTTDKGASDEEYVIRFPSLPFASEKRVGLPWSPRLRSEVKNLSFDLIHTQTEYSMGALGRKLAKKLKIPHIHTFHTLYDDWMIGQLGDNYFSKLVITIMNGLLKKHVQAADAVIVPSQKTLDFLSSYRLTNPVHILPTGIELDRFLQAAEDVQRQKEYRLALGLPLDAFVLSYIGRISEEKEIQRLLDYSKNLLQNRQDFYFLIVGSGPMLETHKSWVQQHKLSKQVLFTGQVPVEEVAYYYALADCFASASRSETQGLTYIEAMACGLPVLAVPDPCLDGVLLDGKNGYFFTDEGTFEQALQKLMNNKEVCHQLKQGAQEMSKNYSVELFIDRLLTLYQAVL